jgi:hypothetical protein
MVRVLAECEAFIEAHEAALGGPAAKPVRTLLVSDKNQ